MAKKHSIHLSTGLRYENAGLLFRVHLDLPEDRADDQRGSVRIFA